VTVRTGEITIAQTPNLALGAFLVSWAVQWLLRPSGQLGIALTLATIGALVWWAADEVLRGVNPWRRFLGSGVLAWEIVRLTLR